MITLREVWANVKKNPWLAIMYLTLGALLTVWLLGWPGEQ